MNDKIISVIVIVLVAIVVIFGLSIFGVIDLSGFGLGSIFGDDNPEDPNQLENITSRWTDLELSDREHHQIISFLTNTTPPFVEHQVYIQGLHMASYGTNDMVTGYGMLQEYEEKYADEDFISYSTGIKAGAGWVAYTEVWYRSDGMGRAVIIGDGASVRNAYGYDVTLTTSYGSVTSYYDYVSFLSRY